MLTLIHRAGSVFSLGGCCTITKCKCILTNSGCLSESRWANLMVTLRQSLSSPSAWCLSSLASQRIKPKKKKTNTVYIWHMQPLPVWKPARLKRSFKSFFFSVSNLPPGKLESAISGASEGRSWGCWIAPVAAELGMVDEGSAALADTLVCCFGCCWASNILLCVRLASRPCPTWPVVMY